MGTSFAVRPLKFALPAQQPRTLHFATIVEQKKDKMNDSTTRSTSGETPFAPSDLSLANLQSEVDTWIKTIGVTYFSELTNMAVLMEEVGELARLMARTYGDQSFKKSDLGKNLPDEMADVLFVLVCLANQCGVDLTQAVRANLEKKSIRDKDRHVNNPKLKVADSVDQT
jgi:NTP pyrophosphatase (non-canonical NTP hydrolase)